MPSSIPGSPTTKLASAPVNPPLASPWRLVTRRFTGNATALVGLSFTATVAFCALFAPWIATFDPRAIDLERIVQAPGNVHLFGTDDLGRDLFSRVVYGARLSLQVGLLAAAISLALGVALGAIAGYAGGWMDAVLMRLTDTFLAMPATLLVIAVLAIFEHPSVTIIYTVLGLLGWPGIARLVRGKILTVREEDYVQAARALGLRSVRTLWRHVLPGALAPIIVIGTIRIADNILTEAWLSFLGLGLEPSEPSWGLMITGGQSYLTTQPWIVIFPGMAIFATTLGFNLLGDGLRDALDPRGPIT